MRHRRVIVSFAVASPRALTLLLALSLVALTPGLHAQLAPLVGPASIVSGPGQGSLPVVKVFDGASQT